MKCYVLSGEPTDSEYGCLVDSCCGIGSKMILVVRDPEMDPGSSISERLAELRPHLIERLRRREWPGTVLYGGEADVYWYEVGPGLGRRLKTMASRLFDWVHPDAPEDPCFFRGDGEVVLVTTSHERDAYLRITEGEFSALEVQFPSLAAMLRFEG